MCPLLPKKKGPAVIRSVPTSSSQLLTLMHVHNHNHNTPHTPQRIKKETVQNERKAPERMNTLHNNRLAVAFDCHPFTDAKYLNKYLGTSAEELHASQIIIYSKMRLTYRIRDIHDI